jgi:alkanesulfonate monooxygenase SsuD/methylene tetrahydromethanopterin reductase-like flavin-dependent oxidoreductase (luciferase family)
MAPPHLAVALDGCGHHPAGWRDPSARPAELFRPGYWAGLARTAERGLLDFLTIEDSFGVQTARRNVPDAREDQVRGRLDAVLIASFMAPGTGSIGLVPTAPTTHTEPFHIASAISTLDHVSRGRGGWRPQVSSRADEAALFGRRDPAEFQLDARGLGTSRLTGDLFEEANDAVEVVRRLWDSWEDDAIIRDVPTGRFIDREKVHSIDFEGRFFSVRGPSIVPRPPQGNPVVAALAHSEVPFRFAARAADVVFVTPADRADVARWVGDIRRAEADVGRIGERLRIFADLVVLLDATEDGAAARKARLDELDGRVYRSDAQLFVGTPDGLVGLLGDWQAQGLDGFRLRPAVIGHDLDQIVDEVVPRLRRASGFRAAYEAGETLRRRLGLPRPESRYVSMPGATG